MDFGEILDRWERGPGTNQRKQESPRHNQGKTPPKQAENREGAAPPPEPPLRRVHPLSAWLRVYGVYDKDAEDPELNGEALPAPERRRRLMARRPDASIDLHGLNAEEAWSALEQFFETSRRQGCRKLVLIHGKGNHSRGDAVLKRIVRQFIEQCPFAGESGHGTQGGTGTTWVLLK
jgi:DNA-nicking Smr family endonuclease